MSKKDKYFPVFTYIFMAGVLWLMAKALGGWVTLVQVMGAMAVMFVIVGTIMAAVIGVIYFLTVFRSNRYAKQLQGAGYVVYLHKHEVRKFAVMALIALFFIPMATWMSVRVYGIRLCIQADVCRVPDDWYFAAPIALVITWLLGLLGLISVIAMWWQSFRPLRSYYKKMQQGQEIDLPRLR